MLRTVWAQASRVVRPTRADDAHDLGGVVQVDEVELEVLARRDVAAVQAGVLLGDLGQRVHLVRGDAAVGQLDAHHLVVFLALAVDAARQAVELEVGLVLVADAELLRPLLELVDLVEVDRQDEAGLLAPGSCREAC